MRIDLGRGHGVHVEELAGGRGPAVVLLHGFGASSATWTPLVPLLAARGHRIVAFDRLGFGRSDRPRRPRHGWGPEGSPYRPSAGGATTVRVLDTLGIDEAILVGHSAGAVAAVLVALEAPARAAGLGLVAPALLAEGPPRFVAAAFGIPGASHVAPWALRRSAGMLPRALRRAWHDPTRIDEATIERYVAPFRTTGWEHALVEMTRAVEPLGLAARLRDVMAPAVVVTGASDRIVRPRDGRHLQQLLGGDTAHVEVPAAGHVVHEEQPEAVDAALAPLFPG